MVYSEDNNETKLGITHYTCSQHRMCQPINNINIYPHEIISLSH